MIRHPAKIVLFAAMMATLSSIPAAAQLELLKLAICKKITTGADRLKCYDDVFTNPTASDPNTAPKVRGQWTYQEDKSPIDDSAQLMASIDGETDGSTLVLRCREHKTEVIFIPGEFFFGTDKAEVLIRINDLEPVTLPWAMSTNNKAMFSYAPAAFSRLLPDNGKLFMRATGFQGRRADATFNLADVSTARDKVANACNWTTPKSSKAN